MDIKIILKLYGTNSEVLALRSFEAKILPILNDHGWPLDVAFRPSPDLCTLSPPLQRNSHLKFPNQDAFHFYRNDPRHQAVRSERARVITKTKIIGSGEIQIYG
jgi:hypothetical protein